MRAFYGRFVPVAVFISLSLGLAEKAHATPEEKSCIEASKDILQKLKCLPGVEVSEQGLQTNPIRQFALRFTQPIDHTAPERGSFQQRVILLHRSESEPMVLQTSGYSIFGVRPTAIMNMFETNQIQIEHRYFSESTPVAPLDWSKLNIRQSADDFHAITVALKQIYTKNWVNTGASKGGMTSVYHRYFYPADLNGTVADVAPLSFSTSDERYVTFVQRVVRDTLSAAKI